MVQTKAESSPGLKNMLGGFCRAASEYVVHAFDFTSRAKEKAHSLQGWRRQSLKPANFSDKIPKVLRTQSEPIPSSRSHSVPQADNLIPGFIRLRGVIRKHNAKLSRLRNDAMAMRTDIVFERANFRDAAKRLERDVQAIMKICNGPAKEALPQSNQQELSLILDAVHSSYQDFESQLSQLHHREAALLDLEHALDEQDKSYISKLNDLVMMLRGDSPSPREPLLPERSPLSSSNASSHTPSLITRYLDRNADASIFRERLDNLDQDHEDERRMREFRRDQDTQMYVTDEEFEDQYRYERKGIEEELQAAVQDAADLEAQCVAHGLDTTFARRYSAESSDDLPMRDGFYFVPRPDGVNAVNNWIDEVPTTAAQWLRSYSAETTTMPNPDLTSEDDSFSPLPPRRVLTC